jgi:hypothetical protein
LNENISNFSRINKMNEIMLDCMLSSTYNENNTNDNQIITEDNIILTYKKNLVNYLYLNDVLEKAQITNNENIKTASLVFLLNSLILKIENNKKDDFINIENELNNIAEQQLNILKSHIKNVFDLKIKEKQNSIINDEKKKAIMTMLYYKKKLIWKLI